MGPQLETIEQNHLKKEEIIDGIFLKDACIGKLYRFNIPGMTSI